MEMDEHSELLQTLVVAARTAEHPQLVGALRRESGGQPTAFTLLVPALPACDQGAAVDLAAGWSDALDRAERAAGRLRESGIELREAIVGDADVAAAIGDAMHSRRFDRVVLATAEPSGGEAPLQLQGIANNSLRFRSPRVGGFLRGRRVGGVILDSRNTASRWQDDARTRSSTRSAPAPAGVAPRSSS